MRESKVERHLHKQVTAAGGTTRKFTGRIHNPDRIVIWPERRVVRGKSVAFDADIHFVETKAPGKTPRPGQVREHNRLRKFGCQVFVLDTIEKVDAYVGQHK